MKRRLEKFGVHFPVMVGPMVGLSHVAFRELVRSYTPTELGAIRFTEMLSTRRLPSEKLQQTAELRTAPGERDLVPQLLGNEEKFIAPSIERLMPMEPFGFDINMGCPVAHILKHNWGVRLMGDTAYAREVVRVTKKHSPRPVSVKLRGGSEETADMQQLMDFTAALEDGGADWLTIHARPSHAGHKGEANWPVVSAIARARGIPVVANGDVQTAEDAITLLTQFDVDGVMVGRAATIRPWILWQVAHRLGAWQPREGEALPPNGLAEESREYFRAAERMIDFLEMHLGAVADLDYLLKKFQFFAATGSRWFLFGHEFWRRTTRAKSLDDLRALVREYQLKEEFPMYERIKQI